MAGFTVGVACALAVTLSSIATGQPDDPGRSVALSPAQMFATVDRMLEAGQVADAELLLRALASDPSLILRSEARFRLGRLRADAGDDRSAIIWYRAILEEEPGSTAVRLELARTYARIGDMASAARELRRSQATRLPLEIARQIDRISAALRSDTPYGFDFSVGLAPDTNINRATASRTIDAQGLTLIVDRDGRATSGVGLQMSATGFSRVRLSSSTDWLTDAAMNATVYPSGRYNDAGVTVAIGPEVRSTNVRFRPSILAGRRYFDGEQLYDQGGVSMEMRRSLGRTTQISSNASMIYFAYPGRRFLDGMAYGVSTDLEKAITPRLLALAGLSASRSAARDPAFATTGGGARLFVNRDAGRFALFGGISHQRLVADAPFSIFRTRRRDRSVEMQVGASARFLIFRGLRPSLRIAHLRNHSTVPIFDFERTRIEFSFGRQF